jgi:hypothetical protein
MGGVAMLVTDDLRRMTGFMSAGGHFWRLSGRGNWYRVAGNKRAFVLARDRGGYTYLIVTKTRAGEKKVFGAVYPTLHEACEAADEAMASKRKKA